MVRNSGATAVVEGTGDHALEYMTGGTVLILGKTGRNLGAGMSGGVAFVYDLETAALNRESVKSGELTVSSLDRADIELVRDLLQTQLDNTGSELAARLLHNFDQAALRFSKILPRDYAAVLEIRKRSTSEDLDDTQLWQRILEVTDGRS